MRNPLQIILLVAGLLLVGATAHHAQAQTIRYVNAARPDNSGNGLTWAAAHQSLQTALAAAQSGDQIWVAQGTYKPTTSTTDRNASFVMKENVKIYGSFPATGEPGMTQRNLGANLTTLSGDIDGDGTLAGNSYHVVYNYNTGLTATALLDGFTVTGGNANGSGADVYGGGMFNYASSPTITNCVFRANYAQNLGGAMANQARCRPLITDCSFQDNSSGSYGGAVGMQQECDVRFINCAFLNNYCGVDGGAVTAQSSNTRFTNCAFQSNSSGNNGGAANLEIGNYNASFTNCSFQDNTALRGGAIFNDIRSTLTNCVLFGNGGENTIVNHFLIVAVNSLIEASETTYLHDGNKLTTTATPFASATSTELSPCSPAVDAVSASEYDGPDTDLAGNPRRVRRLDLGAYEYQGAIPVLFSAALGGDGSAMPRGSAELAVTISGGTSPYSVTYSDGSAQTRVDDYRSGDVIRVRPMVTTIYTLIMARDAGECPASTLAGSVTVSRPANLSLTSLDPAPNQPAAPRSASVAVGFDQPLTDDAATRGALVVFSQQRGGRMQDGEGGTATVSGSTLTFDPATDFKPGETVFATATTEALGQGGGTLARGHVFQFTTAVGGTGRGNFVAPVANPDIALGGSPQAITAGDVDGDGDLDLLTANAGQFGSGVSVRLNDGAGHYSTPAINPETTVGGFPNSIALGDVDGDGDLDFLTANSSSNTVSVRLNDGAGNFSPHPANPETAVGDFPFAVVLADVDGDGDLDFLTVNSSSNSVSVRLNDGTGNFIPPPPTAPSEVIAGIGLYAYSLVSGDVDGDGDLDFLVGGYRNYVSVLLNDGAGRFTPHPTIPEPAIGYGSIDLALGDVDDDGDLDLVAVADENIVVWLNDGAGGFSPHPTNPLLRANFAKLLELGDVDSDGDLDLLIGDAYEVDVRLNDGTGSFTPHPSSPEVPLNYEPTNVVIGDVDNDGDLDFLTTIEINFDNRNFRAHVWLNQPVPPAVTTAVPTGVTAISATLGGQVTDDGGDAVNQRGVVYLTGSGMPTTGDTRVVIDSGTGSFSQNVTGLSPATTYSVRAYATNAIGTSYGERLIFTTQTLTTAAPVVSAPANGSLTSDDTPVYTGTAPAGSTVTVLVDGSSVGTTMATGGGTFSLTQPFALTNGGHTVYATAQANGTTVSPSSNTNTFTVDAIRPTLSITSSASSPTTSSPIPLTFTFSESVTGFTANDVTVTGGTLGGFGGSGGSYSANVTPSAAGTVTVDVAANAAQDAATNGNAAAQFSIQYQLPVVLATVVTAAPTAVTTNSATLGGQVTSDGGGPVTERGVVYLAGSGTPTTGDTKVVIGSGTGSFSQNVTGLNPAATYSVRAYAINSAGTSYGATQSFTTCADITLAITGNTSVTFGYGSNCTTLTADASGGTAPYAYVWKDGDTQIGTQASQPLCPTATTTYTVTATDANGCTGSRQVTVTVNDVRCGNQNQNVVICYYGTTQCVSEKTAERYLKLGATLGPCNSGNTRIGYEPQQQNPSLALAAFPNPVQDAVTVRVVAPTAGEAQFGVVDLTGLTRQAHRENLVEGVNQVKFRLGTLPAGTYLIRCVDAVGRQSVIRVNKQ